MKHPLKEGCFVVILTTVVWLGGIVLFYCLVEWLTGCQVYP